MAEGKNDDLPQLGKNSPQAILLPQRMLLGKMGFF